MRSRGRVCEARIVIEGVNARALADALEPDNETAPPGMSVRCTHQGDRLECTITLDCASASGILRLRNTIDDLLVSLRAAIDSLSGSEDGRG